jgi:hypothetical protein
MKRDYVKPFMEASELEPQYVLAASGTGEDIPWGAPGMNPMKNPFELNNPFGMGF